MKRTLWSILTAAVAALLPGMTGPTADVATPIAEAIKPAPEAVQVRKAEVRHDERRQDDQDDDPSPTVVAPAVALALPCSFSAAPALAAAPTSPEVAPLARRALGPPRVRAPDRNV